MDIIGSVLGSIISAPFLLIMQIIVAMFNILGIPLSILP